MENKIKENAIKIAELRHKTPDVKDISCPIYKQRINDLSKTYSSYDGLMPIVFECNMGPAKYGFIDIQFKRKYVQYLCDENPAYFEFLEFDDEYKFMEALQLCCIKYLEVKNGYTKRANR